MGNLRIRNTRFKIQGFGNPSVSDFGFFTLNSRREGFTLLELMISIAILGIIILIVTGAVRLGFRSVDSGEKKIESLERIRASLTLMDSQIQSELPLTYDEDGSRKYYFRGSRDSVRFSTNYSLWGGEKGYVLVTYRVVPDGSGRQALYVSESALGTGGASEEIKLLDAFSSISFEYFYKEPSEEKGSWVTEWTDETTVPGKIKVHLTEGTKDIALILPMRTRGSLAQAPSIPQPSPVQPPPGALRRPRR